MELDVSYVGKSKSYTYKSLGYIETSMSHR